ncbi:hypothetical protein BO70DRAFT_193778 [Aspergillus heteromorphus CBS 117.55]|uniref:Uncharacterized protein n=1 Tax=Aspergillus heteromorphus CBS 117.55 TaxID=1448321 RepID=A0A317WNQ3_9EURO|nr:uncharacterized protein BO70DRAFT_193778 [Aspergillus heteromorphus CBS 117.55]PWY87401.1 hypothetical protein BO70DRAFT_193778 [Aspergillus heteromorphus CBS 117.55]
MSYNIYTTEEIGERNHVAIFIETRPDAPVDAIRGQRYHVIGTILRGMAHDPKESVDPEEIPGHVPGTKKLVATIAPADMARFEAICEEVPPPPPQLTLSGKPMNLAKPLYRCGDWVREVLSIAVEEGIIRAVVGGGYEGGSRML